MLAPVDDENRGVVPEAERKVHKRGVIGTFETLKLEQGKWGQLFPR